MAEQKANTVAVDNSGKKKLLLIIIIVLLLAVIGVLAALLLTNNHDNTAETSPANTVAARQAPVYYTVESPFIVNFSTQSNNAVRYLQIKMKVMARNQQAIDAFSQNLPAIQHDLLLLYYSQNYDDLQTNGSRPLQQASLNTINTLLQSTTGQEDGLEAVYFTSFLMQ